MNSGIIKLSMLGLPVIQTIDDLSMLTRISKYTLYQLSINSDKHYRVYEIPKKSSGKRIIYQPSRRLKGLQSWILVSILNKISVSTSCKGFRKGSSTYDNAFPHIGANTVLSLDIKDFFPSVSSVKVFNIFKTIGYNNLISTIFTNICTCQCKLPQGSPCSPMLANLAAWNLDLRIQGYVGKRGITYTRYADDLSFSGLNPKKVAKIALTINKIIECENFSVNKTKTRISSSSRARIITGLVINEENVGVGKNIYKLLRSKIHHLTLPNMQTNQKLLYHVKGWISYLNSVDKQRHIRIRKYIVMLNERFPNTLLSQLL